MGFVFCQKWFLLLRCSGGDKLDRPNAREFASMVPADVGKQGKQIHWASVAVPNSLHKTCHQETFSQNPGKLREKQAVEECPL
jgi:hypothetical protein